MTLFIVLAAMLAVSLLFLLLPLRRRRRSLRFALLVALWFSCGAAGLYALLGSPGILPLMAQRRQLLDEARGAITARAMELRADPENLPAWVSIGQSFMQTMQYDAAANAFRQAVLLSGGNPVLIQAYAEALILAASGTVSDEARRSMQMVLMQQPDNGPARYYLARRELQDGDTEQAMHHMRELYHSLPEDSPLKARIDRDIGRR